MNEEATEGFSIDRCFELIHLTTISASWNSLWEPLLWSWKEGLDTTPDEMPDLHFLRMRHCSNARLGRIYLMIMFEMRWHTLIVEWWSGFSLTSLRWLLRIGLRLSVVNLFIGRIRCLLAFSGHDIIIIGLRPIFI